MVLFIMVINLRGVKESGATFAIPTYFFVVLMFLTVGVGFYRYLTGTLDPVVNPPALAISHAVQAITPFLILHAFPAARRLSPASKPFPTGLPLLRNLAVAMRASP
jgi:amino acid transporter